MKLPNRYFASVMRSSSVLIFCLACTFSATSAAASQSAGAFDLIVRTPIPNQRDLNGFLLNPQWHTERDLATIDPPLECGIFAYEGVRGFRSLLLRNPECFGDEQRSVLRLSEPRELVVHGLACNQPLRDGSPGGHLNWFPVTFTGTLQYNGVGNAAGGDYDYTFELFPDSRAPSTRYNDRKTVERVDTLFADGVPLRIDTVVDTLFSLHTEFDYRETINRIAETTRSRWWRQIQQLPRNNAQSTRRQIDTLLGEGRVIVTGLFNLDMVHHGHAEVHPVYAIALLQGIEPGMDNEVVHHWKLFVRDRGNEGNCSSEAQIVFQSPNSDDPTTNRYRFNLEEPEGATGAPRIIASQSWVGRAGPMQEPTFSWVPGDGLIATVTWPRPNQASADAIVMAEISIAWPGNFDRREVRGRTRALADMTDNALGNTLQMNQASAIRRTELPTFNPEKRRHSLGANDYTQRYYDSLATIVDVVAPIVFDTVPTLVPSEPVPPHTPISFELQPPLYLCRDISLRWIRAPRCSSALSLSASLGAQIRSPWTTTGLSIQHARVYLGIPTIPLRLDAEFAWRGASGDESSPDFTPAAQRIEGRLTALPHFVPLLHDAWWIVTIGGGVIHESGWPAVFSAGLGLGIPVRQRGPRITLEGKGLLRKWANAPSEKALYLSLQLRLL